jgi:hypothetical protein
MSVVELPLDRIRTDGGTQMRAALDPDVYFDYRDKWLAGVEFAPIDVFFDGSTYWLADGFHRFYGAREAKRPSIPCRVHNGTQRDAILFACGANAAHGLRRTNEDKRIAVTKLLSDEAWVLWSDNRIADQAAVSVQLVCVIRGQLSTVDNSPAAKTANEPKTGKDGKKYKPRRKPVASAKPEPPPTSREREPSEGDGKLDFDDSVIDTYFGKLICAVDERAEVLGGGEGHKACITDLRSFQQSWRAWRRERT